MYRIGVDLGGTNIATGVVNEKNETYVEDRCCGSSSCTDDFWLWCDRNVISNR